MREISDKHKILQTIPSQLIIVYGFCRCSFGYYSDAALTTVTAYLQLPKYMNSPADSSRNLWFHVDDDLDDLTLYADVLSETAPQIILEQFTSSIELIRRLNGNEAPRLILIDLNMPVVDGLGCLKHVKIIPHVSKVSRLVILSTNSNKEMIDYCYAMGAHYYAVKPSDPEKIRELLLKLVAISDSEPRFPVGKKQFLLTD